jgi:hypothetical protein
VPSGQPLVVSAKLFSDGEGAKTAASPGFQRLAEVAGSNGTPYYRYLADQQVLLQVVPLDTKLPGLAAACSDAWAREAFARALGISRREIHVAEAGLIRYKAWHRAVIRYVVECQGRRLCYFAKVFRDGRGRAMFSQLNALKAQLRAAGDFWEIPSPVMYAPPARMLVLEALEGGVELKALVDEAARDPLARPALRKLIARVPEELALFQKLTVDGLPIVTPTGLLRWIGKRVRGLHHVAPSLAQSAERRLSFLQAEADRLPPELMVTTHGAFRHTQILVCGDKLGVIDLDGIRLSGANFDAAEFLSCLDRISVRRARLRSLVQDMAEVFLTALERNAGFDPRWIAWYRAAANVKHALSSYVALSPRWKEGANGLLDLGDWAAEG